MKCLTLRWLCYLEMSSSAICESKALFVLLLCSNQAKVSSTSPEVLTLAGEAGRGSVLRTQHLPPGPLGGRQWNGAGFSRKGESLYFLHNIFFWDFVACEKASVGTSETRVALLMLSFPCSCTPDSFSSLVLQCDFKNSEHIHPAQA